MTIQYSLQAADERPIHSSICCRPKSPDASLVRGPLQANWKTEAITQRQCLCVYVRVCWGGRHHRENSEREKKNEGNNWQWMEGMRNRERRRKKDIPPLRKNSWPVSTRSRVAILKKPPAGTELTQHKPTLCNESGPVILSYYKYVFALYKSQCLRTIYNPLFNG